MTSADARFERNPDFVFRRIVDEVVLVPIRQQVADMDCIYTLNGVGAFVWEHLDGRTSLADIQAAVLSEYDASSDEVAADLDEFVQHLEGVGAIRRV